MKHTINNESASGNEHLKPEYRVIMDLVQPKSNVLDLGCGDGELLKALQTGKQVRAQGIELSEDAIQACVEKGLFVFHGDLDEGLADFPDKSVDYIIATNTLQTLHKPDFLIREMARVGKRCIIGVPNFAYWKVRLDLLINGRMPKTRSLPYEWYDSPNIHLTTIRDFREFCERNDIRIVQQIAIRLYNNNSYSTIQFMPNLFADYAIFVIE